MTDSDCSMFTVDSSIEDSDCAVCTPGYLTVRQNSEMNDAWKVVAACMGAFGMCCDSDRRPCFSCVPGASKANTTGHWLARSLLKVTGSLRSSAQASFFKMEEVLRYKCAICGCICSAEAFQVHNSLVITLFDTLDYRNNVALAQVVKGHVCTSSAFE